ncbi:MAG: NAD(P)H-binding protein [Candidatus Heimdallarchaeota archaeon]|nr:NAD(P)H-binding protein [Candidatus Heimdallarchaeota archaeon]
MQYCVTGAFSYTGKYIARELLKTEDRISTLTNHPDSDDPFFDRIDVLPYSFDDFDQLVQNLTGVDVLVNTYWIRFTYKHISFDDAVENSRILFTAANAAGVKRILHISVTNPSKDSPYPYFKGKYQVEEHLKASEVTYSIIRPALVFAPDDVLINNIGYLLRRFPFFIQIGDGSFKLQPISQQDLAKFVVSRSILDANEIVDAVGPETYTFQELVELLIQATNSRCKIIQLSSKLSWIIFAPIFILNVIKRDKIITKHEIGALVDNLLLTESNPVGKEKLSDFIQENATILGKQYIHEINRHFIKGGRTKY